jgi:PAS domain S-box-containing protein
MNLDAASAALDAYDGLYFLVDDDGTLTEWNAAVEELTGSDNETLPTLSAVDLFEECAENGISDALAGARETGEATVEAPLLLADGDVRPFEIELLCVDGGVAGIGQDVTQRTEQRDSLQRRERVLRGMYDVVSDTDRSFEEQVESLLLLGREELGVDYGTLSRIEGEEYIFEVVHSDDDTIQAGDVVPVAATNCELVATSERTLVLGDVGEDAPEEAHRAGYTEWGISCYLGAPVMVDDEVYGTFCFYDTQPRSEGFSAWHVTLVDLMSRWVGYELQRQRTNERLRRQNEKLNHFASIVSHDLRNPLNVLNGSLGLAEETGEAEHFERAERAAERMETLIDDLLVLARAGDTIEETEPVGIGTLARNCWAGVDTGGASLTVLSDRTVLADATRLRQLFENLIRNVVEHGSAGSESAAADDGTANSRGVTVTIGDLEDGFYVADDGVGIPEAEREKIFESGFSTREGGTGFGLSIVTEIADAHGWAVRATESEDGGARFEFTGVKRPATTDPEAAE